MPETREKQKKIRSSIFFSDNFCMRKILVNAMRGHTHENESRSARGHREHMEEEKKGERKKERAITMIYSIRSKKNRKYMVLMLLLSLLCIWFLYIILLLMQCLHVRCQLPGGERWRRFTDTAGAH